MKGYRRYYDGEKYVVDDEVSEVQKLPKDSTTSWFKTHDQALVAANIDNIGELIAYNNAAYLRILKLVSDEIGVN